MRERRNGPSPFFPFHRTQTQKKAWSLPLRLFPVTRLCIPTGRRRTSLGITHVTLRHPLPSPRFLNYSQTTATFCSNTPRARSYPGLSIISLARGNQRGKLLSSIYDATFGPPVLRVNFKAPIHPRKVVDACRPCQILLTLDYRALLHVRPDLWLLILLLTSQHVQMSLLCCFFFLFSFSFCFFFSLLFFSFLFFI